MVATLDRPRALEWPDMSPRRHIVGDETRDRIMREIRRSHAAGEPLLTQSELARRLGMNQSTVSRQGGHLVKAGELVLTEVATGIFVFRLPD